MLCLSAARELAAARVQGGPEYLTLLVSAAGFLGYASARCWEPSDRGEVGVVFLYRGADRGMYFILRLTQLIVRSDSRLGERRYKIAPKCLLPGPFGHSGVVGNPGVAGTVRSYNLGFTYLCQGGNFGMHVGHGHALPCVKNQAPVESPPRWGRALLDGTG